MSKRKEVKYCVTTVNTFTGVREIVTPPCTYERACEVLNIQKRYDSDTAAYRNLKVVPYRPQQLCHSK
jgi:hypothetical protein